MENFEGFHQVISSSINLLYLKSVFFYFFEIFNPHLDFYFFPRHNQVSDLHKNNMEAWHREHKPQSGREHRPQSGASNLGGGYRDRAQERRQKYGIGKEKHALKKYDQFTI